MLNEIRKELVNIHTKDLHAIKQYAQWLRLRRLVNSYFYLVPQMHWVRAPIQAHWVGG